MNQVIIDSWYFFKNNAKELCAFMLPLFALSMVTGVLSVVNPQSVVLGMLSGVQFMIGPLFTGALLLYIANISKGEYPPQKDMLAQAMPFWITILVVSIVTGLAIGLGVMLLVIPGLWLLLRLFLAPLYVVFQNKSVTDAISSAFADSKDHLLPFFQILMPFVVLSVVFLMVVMGRGQSSILFTSLINIGTTFGFIFASVVQFRMYSVYIENQAIDEQDDED